MDACGHVEDLCLLIVKAHALIYCHVDYMVAHLNLQLQNSKF